MRLAAAALLTTGLLCEDVLPPPERYAQDFCFGAFPGSSTGHEPQRVPDGYFLEAVQVVARHGHRSPFVPSKFSFLCEPISGQTNKTGPSVAEHDGATAAIECDLQQTTTLGSQQSLKLGEALAWSYVTQNEFLTVPPNSDEIAVFVDSPSPLNVADRLYTTAMLVLKGLFPNTQGLVAPQAFDSENCTSKIVDFFQILFSESARKIYKSANIPWRKVQHELGVPQKLSASMYLEWELVPWFNQIDTLNMVMCLPTEVPELSVMDEIRAAMYAMDLKMWDLLWNKNSVLSRKQTRDFFKRALSLNFQAKFQGTTPQKFWVYVTHDTSLAPMMALMGFPKRLWAQPVLGAYIVFELLRKKNTQTEQRYDEHDSAAGQDLFVRVLYNNRPVHLSSCEPASRNHRRRTSRAASSETGMCSWSQWTSLMHQVIEATDAAFGTCAMTEVANRTAWRTIEEELKNRPWSSELGIS